MRRARCCMSRSSMRARRRTAIASPPMAGACSASRRRAKRSAKLKRAPTRRSTRSTGRAASAGATSAIWRSRGRKRAPDRQRPLPFFPSLAIPGQPARLGSGGARMTTTIDRQTAYSGTKEVAAPLRLDVARLETYLATNAKGFKGPLSVKQFKGGQSNPTYLLETPARKYVLRRKPPGKLLPSAHAVDREFKAISALSAQGFPVAEPVVYCADE